MWSLLLVLLLTPASSASFTDHYPPGYYFISADQGNVTQPGLFYVRGAPSYQMPAVSCNPTSTLRDSLALIYRTCGAVTIDPKAYFQQWNYRPLVEGNVGPHFVNSAEPSQLILYSVTGSELELCGTDHGAYRLSECLTPEQQRLTQCLHDNLPPTVVNDCMPIWGLMFLCMVGLVVLMPVMIFLGMLSLRAVRWCIRTRCGVSKPVEIL